MVSADPKDPYSSFNFDVAIDDVPLGAFSEVSGLTAEGDAIDYYESAYPQSNERKLTGLHKYTNITLKRGYTHRTGHCGIGIAIRPTAKVIAARSL